MNAHSPPYRNQPSSSVPAAGLAMVVAYVVWPCNNVLYRRITLSSHSLTHFHSLSLSYIHSTRIYMVCTCAIWTAWLEYIEMLFIGSRATVTACAHIAYMCVFCKIIYITMLPKLSVGLGAWEAATAGVYVLTITTTTERTLNTFNNICYKPYPFVLAVNFLVDARRCIRFNRAYTVVDRLAVAQNGPSINWATPHFLVGWCVWVGRKSFQGTRGSNKNEVASNGN